MTRNQAIGSNAKSIHFLSQLHEKSVVVHGKKKRNNNSFFKLAVNND